MDPRLIEAIESVAQPNWATVVQAMTRFEAYIALGVMKNP
jgi:hypothetical protein